MADRCGQRTTPACLTPRTRIGLDRAEIGLLEGEQAVVDRAGRTATFLALSLPDDGRLLHPFLTAVATVFAWWEGHVAIHGGAFATEAGAWAVVGEREGGKSSTLAALALAGRRVLADDLIVLSGETVLAGPRCIDLRPGVSEALEVETRVRAVRGGERFRLVQRPVEPECPLCGWVSLTWSERLEVRALSPGQRLDRLRASSSVPPPEPRRLMDLAKLPAWELSRPATLSSLEPAVDRLLSLTGS